MRGEEVTIRTHVQVGTDPYGAPVTEPQEEAVENVLVAPGSLADLGEDRPEGVDVAYSLCIPRTYSGDLEGAEVQVRGEWLRVIGHPDRIDGFGGRGCPTDWNMVCEVGTTHG